MTARLYGRGSHSCLRVGQTSASLITSTYPYPLTCSTSRPTRRWAVVAPPSTALYLLLTSRGVGSHAYTTSQIDFHDGERLLYDSIWALRSLITHTIPLTWATAAREEGWRLQPHVCRPGGRWQAAAERGSEHGFAARDLAPHLHCQ